MESVVDALNGQQVASGSPLKRKRAIGGVMVMMGRNNENSGRVANSPTKSISKVVGVGAKIALLQENEQRCPSPLKMTPKPDLPVRMSSPVRMPLSPLNGTKNSPKTNSPHQTPSSTPLRQPKLTTPSFFKDKQPSKKKKLNLTLTPSTTTGAVSGERVCLNPLYGLAPESPTIAQPQPSSWASVIESEKIIKTLEDLQRALQAFNPIARDVSNPITPRSLLQASSSHSGISLTLATDASAIASATASALKSKWSSTSQLPIPIIGESRNLELPSSLAAPQRQEIEAPETVISSDEILKLLQELGKLTSTSKIDSTLKKRILFALLDIFEHEGLSSYSLRGAVIETLIKIGTRRCVSFLAKILKGSISSKAVAEFQTSGTGKITTSSSSNLAALAAAPSESNAQPTLDVSSANTQKPKDKLQEERRRKACGLLSSLALHATEAGKKEQNQSILHVFASYLTTWIHTLQREDDNFIATSMMSILSVLSATDALRNADFAERGPSSTRERSDSSSSINYDGDDDGFSTLSEEELWRDGFKTRGEVYSCLFSKKESVRMLALTHLLYQGASSSWALSYIKELMENDKSSSVRIFAMRVISDLVSTSEIPTNIIESVLSLSRKDKDDSVRNYATSTLLKLAPSYKQQRSASTGSLTSLSLGLENNGALPVFAEAEELNSNSSASKRISLSLSVKKKGSTTAAATIRPKRQIAKTMSLEEMVVNAIMTLQESSSSTNRTIGVTKKTILKYLENNYPQLKTTDSKDNAQLKASVGIVLMKLKKTARVAKVPATYHIPA